jgi:hypothetical protein
MDDSDWTEEELNPIKYINVNEVTGNYSTLGATIILSDNREFKVDFQDIDGRRRC